MAPAKTWVVVGASRGLGHEFVRHLLARGDNVVATVRHLDIDAKPWQDESRCHVYECDMLSASSIEAFSQQLAHDHTHIDHLVLNAGVLKYPNRATELSYDDFVLHLHTNTVGPVLTAQKVLKHGLAVDLITFISSDSGSAQCFREMEDGFAAYAASKAALNQMIRHMAAELKRKGSRTAILALHPGEVQTDMANIDVGWDVGGQMSPAESISSCLSVIESKGMKDNGTFWTWENKPYPW